MDDGDQELFRLHTYAMVTTHLAAVFQVAGWLIVDKLVGMHKQWKQHFHVVAQTIKRADL